jgi:hypothetical protein
METNQHGLQPEPETPEHGGDLALSSIVMIGLAGTAILVVVIILIRGLFVNMLEQERYSKVILQKPVELMQVREQALNRLNAYDWIDRAQGIVSIPIDQAMALAAVQLSAEQRQPAPPAAPAVEEVAVVPGADVAAQPAGAGDPGTTAKEAQQK